MAEYTAYQSDIRGQMPCFYDEKVVRKGEVGARILTRQASVSGPVPTLCAKIRYYRYTQDYITIFAIELHLLTHIERRRASGDEMLWHQLIGKDYGSREELARDLGLALREQRTLAGLTQAELAERINVDEVSVRRWELGLRLPSIETLLQLEAVFLEENR